MTLWEQCAILEERVNVIAERLPDEDRQVPEAYIDMQNEPDYQSVKTSRKMAEWS